MKAEDMINIGFGVEVENLHFANYKSLVLRKV